MTAIRSGQDLSHLTIGPTSKGSRASNYSSANKPLSQKYTYRAYSSATIANSTVPFFVMRGSKTNKLIRIQRIIISAATSSSSAAYLNFDVRKYSAVRGVLAVTAGTATNMVAVPMDSLAPVSTAIELQIFTTVPTVNAAATAVDCDVLRYITQAGTVSATAPTTDYIIDTRSHGDYSPIFLDNNLDQIGVALVTGLGTTAVVHIIVEWTEE